MQPIKTLYVVNHSHTDIGFTDYQDLCFRQHAEFIDQALDLIEETQDLPKEAQYRWTCEVTGMTEKYFAKASSAQIERFKKWHDAGYIDVAGMQYNHTPMQNAEQMIRSLYPVQRLRDQYGLNISSAMQCDVNGISWLYADLLAEVGIELMTMAVNPLRGYTPKPIPNAFWWEGPSGRKDARLERVPLSLGSQHRQVGRLALRRRFVPADRRRAGSRSRLSLRLHVRPIDSSDARRQRTARPAYAGVRRTLERRRTHAAHRVHHPSHLQPLPAGAMGR